MKLKVVTPASNIERIFHSTVSVSEFSLQEDTEEKRDESKPRYLELLGRCELLPPPQIKTIKKWKQNYQNIRRRKKSEESEI